MDQRDQLNPLDLKIANFAEKVDKIYRHRMNPTKYRLKIGVVNFGRFRHTD